MVGGLDRFRAYLGAYGDQYVLIGGTACTILMDEAGLEFRATKDIDIVLCVEQMNASFVQAFWEFIRSGRYALQQSATGNTRYYRFMKPEECDYPYMLELFSRKPDGFDLAEGSYLTPIPVDDAVSSLSAILLDDTYYAFLRSGRRISEGLPVVGPEHLVPLKARAWLELKARRRDGALIDSKSINKHRNDIIRLYRLVDPNFNDRVPDLIAVDMAECLELMRTESIDLKPLGLKGYRLDSILNELRRLYVSG